MIPVAILCGGKGTRIARGEQDTPKPLIDVGGRPILWHVMALYAAQGFNDFVLLTGWRSERIVGALEAFDEVAAGDWTVRTVDTGDDTPTGGRVAAAAGILAGGAFALTYADGVADIDLVAEYGFHRSHESAVTMALVQPESPWGEATLDPDGRITGFVEKPRLDGWINGGFMIVEPRALGFIGDDEVLEQGPLERLAVAGELRGYRHRGFWECMDTFKDALALNELCAEAPPPWLTIDTLTSAVR
ncbi:MAG: sugar phosphate nucleotidyltransferase [Solirubrobacterales bacterium]